MALVTRVPAGYDTLTGEVKAWDYKEELNIEIMKMHRKIEWITANGYRGVFWWEFHHDYVAPEAGRAGSHYLIDGVTDYLKKQGIRPAAEAND